MAAANCLISSLTSRSVITIGCILPAKSRFLKTSKLLAMFQRALHADMHITNTAKYVAQNTTRSIPVFTAHSTCINTLDALTRNTNPPKSNPTRPQPNPRKTHVHQTATLRNVAVYGAINRNVAQDPIHSTRLHVGKTNIATIIIKTQRFMKHQSITRNINPPKSDPTRP